MSTLTVIRARQRASQLQESLYAKWERVVFMVKGVWSPSEVGVALMGAMFTLLGFALMIFAAVLQGGAS